MRLIGIFCRYMHCDIYLDHFPQPKTVFNLLYSTIITYHSSRYLNCKEIQMLTCVLT